MKFSFLFSKFLFFSFLTSLYPLVTYKNKLHQMVALQLVTSWMRHLPFGRNPLWRNPVMRLDPLVEREIKFKQKHGSGFFKSSLEAQSYPLLAQDIQHYWQSSGCMLWASKRQVRSVELRNEHFYFLPVGCLDPNESPHTYASSKTKESSGGGSRKGDKIWHAQLPQRSSRSCLACILH